MTGRFAAWLAIWVFLPPAFADMPSIATLGVGMQAIHDRYIAPVPYESIVLHGINGLATLDPAFDAQMTPERRIGLRYRNHAIGSFGLPLADDLGGWTRVMEQAVHEALLRSPLLAKSDSDALTEAMFDGFLSDLDIFSHYAGPREARERRANRDGYGGIGVRYEQAGNAMRIIEVIADSPAAQAHLKAGDEITAIEGESVAGWDLDRVALKLRGPIGSAIKLSVKHGDGAPSPLTLHRAQVVPTTVTYRQDKDYAVIAISAFADNTAEITREAVKKARLVPGMKGIILDLRGNLGGVLEQAVQIADLFIDQGRILTTRGRHPESLQTRETKPGDAGESLPVVALIDGETASAAEILAADLQDHGRGVLVGSNTFGKGVIQTVIEDMPNSGEMTLTWSRFYTPSGYALHGLGVMPNICTSHGRAPSRDRGLAGGSAASVDFFAQWRQVALDDNRKRLALRGHCPAMQRKGAALDETIARHLLADAGLYMQALAVAAPLTRR